MAGLESGLEPETYRADGDLAYGGVGDLTLDPGAENDADDPVAEDAQPTAMAPTRARS